MTLVAHVAHLRTLAVLDSETTLLDRAVIEVLGELAEAVDALSGRLGINPPDDGDHLGTI
jgi:hypothetical protein